MREISDHNVISLLASRNDDIANGLHAEPDTRTAAFLGTALMQRLEHLGTVLVPKFGRVRQQEALPKPCAAAFHVSLSRAAACWMTARKRANSARATRRPSGVIA
jgi:hypothetical protein